MKKKNLLTLSAGMATLALLGVIISANPRSFDMAKAANAERNCAKIEFGTTANSNAVDLGTDMSKFSTYGITVSSIETTKIFCTSAGEAAKFGSSSAGGSLTFNFSSLVITSVRLYAFEFSSSVGAAAITVQTSALSSAQSGSVSNADVPTLTDLSGTGIYLFSGLDGGIGTSSTSLTITSTSKRFYLSKILFTINGSSSTSSSATSTTSSSAPTSSSSEAAASSITLDSALATTKTYTTGDYGTVTSDSIQYGFYRSYKDSGTLDRLIAPSYSGSIAGAFYNIDAIKQITSITLNYKTASSTDAGAKLYAGSSSLLTSYQSVAASLSASTLSFSYPSSDNIAYFRLDCGTSDLTIYSLTISYLGGGSSSLVYGSSGASLYRINPVVYSGTLTSGVSSVSVPTSITPNGSAYSVSGSKTYTYYTYASVDASPALANAAAYTEPADVAAYFTAFGTYPANYVLSANYSTAYSLFGNKTRCVSAYSKTTGYVTALPPTRLNGSVTYEDYYECDIDLTGSYASSSSSPSRGAGRVVVFKGGFDSSLGATGYTTDPVAVFTDDHYATFQEYYNYGTTFSTRFDAEKTRTFYQWGCPSVLNAA